MGLSDCLCISAGLCRGSYLIHYSSSAVFRLYVGRKGRKSFTLEGLFGCLVPEKLVLALASRDAPCQANLEATVSSQELLRNGVRVATADIQYVHAISRQKHLVLSRKLFPLYLNVDMIATSISVEPFAGDDAPLLTLKFSR